MRIQRLQRDDKYANFTYRTGGKECTFTADGYI